MKYEDEPGRAEDLFALARRALREELGLLPNEYGPIVFSWFGWSHPASSFLTIGSVRAHLTASEIDDRRGQCHSVYEHDKAAWVPFKAANISRIICKGTSPDGESPWSYLAPVVAFELWRSRFQH
jgi:8-oxo-dGTP pyrophosphatase MutT (NUDIX family)